LSRFDEDGALDRWDHDIPEVIGHIHEECEVGTLHVDMEDKTPMFRRTDEEPKATRTVDHSVARR